ncbi:hypothetical protein NRP93_003556, partial [Clostridium botulinum]|nr:hypothetical protein [Clostridium botulinum]
GTFLGTKGLDKITKGVKGLISGTETATIKSLEHGATQALEAIKDIVKKAGTQSIEELNKIVTRVYSRINGILDVEIAGYGRIRIKESSILDDADKICKDRYTKWAEGKSLEGRSNPKAKEIIRERVNRLDLSEHQLINKQLSSKKMSEIKNKINNRTATKVEYETYKWNKKFSKRRREGVKQFWNQERERIINGESTTRNWSAEQIEHILNGKTPKYNGKPIQGHHSYSASKYPHLADKGEIIYPVTPNEHLKGWHGGNFKNSKPGEPIIEIIDFE